jgi:hypothetical protein
LDIEGKRLYHLWGSTDLRFPSEIIKSESKTSSAEALRLIRTNLEFMLTKVSDGIAKTIFVTSTFLTKERLLFRQILHDFRIVR